MRTENEAEPIYDDEHACSPLYMTLTMKHVREIDIDMPILSGFSH